MTTNTNNKNENPLFFPFLMGNLTGMLVALELCIVLKYGHPDFILLDFIIAAIPVLVWSCLDFEKESGNRP